MKVVKNWPKLLTVLTFLQQKCFVCVAVLQIITLKHSQFFFHQHKISRNKSCNVNAIGKLDNVTTGAVVTTSSIFRLWLRRHMDQLQNATRTLSISPFKSSLVQKKRTGTVSNFCAGWNRCCWKMFTTQTSKNSTEDWPATVICYFYAPSATGSPISSNHVFMFFSQISWSSKSQTHNTKHNKKQHNNQSVIF